MKNPLGFLLICIISLSLLSCKDHGVSIVNQGYADLSHWDVEKDAFIRLDGQWEFYWKQITENEDKNKQFKLYSNEFISIPNTWNVLGYPEKGFGSYRVRICLPQNDSIKYSIKIPKSNFTADVFVDGNKILSTGKYAKNEKQFLSDGKPIYFDLPSNVDEVDLIISIANSQHKKGGGFTQGVIIAAKNKMEQKRNLSIISQGSTTIFIVLVCFYQLFIFLTYRRKKIFLYLGAFCLIGSLRQLFVDEILIYEFLPNLPYSTVITWRNIVLSIGSVFGVLYYRELNPDDSKPWFFKYVFVVSVLCFLFVVFSPPAILKTQIRMVNKYLAASVFVYVLWLSFTGIFRKRKFARTIFLSTIIAIAFFSYDLLYLENIVINNNGYLTNYGLITFILLQTIVNFRFTREMELEFLMLSDKVEDLQEEMNFKKEELTRLHSESIQQLKIKQEVTEKLSKIHKSSNSNFLSEIVAELKSYRIEDERILVLKENLQEINYEFVNRLSKKHKNLTKTDIEICSFIRFGFSSSEIADLRFTSKLSVKSSRYRIRKKLLLPQQTRLTNYLKEI